MKITLIRRQDSFCSTAILTSTRKSPGATPRCIVRLARPYAHVLIQVDGNVSWENAVKMRAAGADVFVCGTSSIFSKGAPIAKNIARFREIVK